MDKEEPDMQQYPILRPQKLNLSGTSAQLAELIDLTQVLEMGKRKIAIYTDSKYAFLVLHAHAAIWKERGHLNT